MEDLKTIDKIMEVVTENLSLSADICKEYGFEQTEDYLRKALVCLADAKITKEFEQSQKIELEQIANAINLQFTANEASELIKEFNNIESEESNGC